MKSQRRLKLSGGSHMRIQYSSHGDSHKVAVVHCPKICGKRLVHLSQNGPDSWVIRDYIRDRELRRSPAPNQSFSQFRLDKIEDEVVWFEKPPFHALKNRIDWQAYLRLRSMVILGKGGSASQGKLFGTWKRIKK
jgi:hypothetical protein